MSWAAFPKVGSVSRSTTTGHTGSFGCFQYLCLLCEEETQAGLVEGAKGWTAFCKSGCVSGVSLKISSHRPLGLGLLV